MCKVYFYKSHYDIMGDWYYMYERLSADDLYCEACGGSDTLIGEKEFDERPTKEKIEEIGDRLYADYLESRDD